MATGNSVSIAALRPTIWQKELYQDVIDNLYFTKNGMMGKDDNNIVQLKDDLMKEKGGTVTYGLTAKLSGSGVTGDAELEGNEEKITPYSDSISIDKKRNAVRTAGKLDEQRNSYDIRMDAKNKLSIWMQEFVERQVFLKLGGVRNTSLTDVNGDTVGTDALWSNSPNVVSSADETAGYGARYLSAAYDPASGTGNNASMSNVHKLSPSLITRLRTKATLASPKVVPLRIEGRNHYVLFVHPWQANDLKSHPTYEAAQQYANVRGDKNPIFTGALGVWDGVIVHEHEYVPFLDVSAEAGTANFAGDSDGLQAAVDITRAVLCGRQAMAWAKAKYDKGWVEKSFDYDDKDGISTGILCGFQNVSFNSKLYGEIILDTYATPVS